MANMALTLFANRLDAEGIRYDILTDSILTAGMTASNCSLRLFFDFEEDCSGVKIIAGNFAKVPENKREQFYKILNEWNRKYKHVCFTMEEDGELRGSDDDFIELDSCAEECFHLMMVMVMVIDDAYPEIMKAIWA